MRGCSILLFLMFTTVTFSQTLEEIELCTALQSNQFYSEVEADSALDRILDASGLAKNFTLTQCDNIDNAAAITYKGIRYILYDKEFLQTITDNTNDWANLFVLAHEVGHHLNGHSVDVSMIDIVESKTLATKRKQELEADEFAAFILAQLGAPLNALIEPIELVVSDADDTYSTHPKKSSRIEVIKRGYSKVLRPKSEPTNSESLSKSTIKEASKWRSSNSTDDPFSSWRYSSWTRQTNKNEWDSYFEIGSHRDYGVYFSIEAYESSFWEEYLNDIEKLKNGLRELSATVIRSYVIVKVNFQFAVDNKYIGKAESTGYYPKRGDRKVRLIPLYNFFNDDYSENNMDFKIEDLVKEIKKGKILTIKIVDITYAPAWMSSSPTFHYKKELEKKVNLESNSFLKFSLDGSSASLSWY